MRSRRHREETLPNIARRCRNLSFAPRGPRTREYRGRALFVNVALERARPIRKWDDTPLGGDGDACMSPADTPAGTRAVTIAIMCPIMRAENPEKESNKYKKCRIPRMPRVRNRKWRPKTSGEERGCQGTSTGEASVSHVWPPIAFCRVDRESYKFRVWESVISGPLMWQVRVCVRSRGPSSEVSFARLKFRELSSPVRNWVTACRLNTVNRFYVLYLIASFWLARYSIIPFVFVAYTLVVNCKILMSRMRDLRPECTSLRRKMRWAGRHIHH